MTTEPTQMTLSGEGAGFTTAVTEAVVDSMSGTADPRLRELLTALTRHLHAFVRETEPTMEEWERAIGFLTATGQTCTDTRQEFILLSDVLGVSMLVETLNGHRDPGATESTVLGPFHMTESPVRELGADIDLVGAGEPCVVSGRVLDRDGTPLPGAVLDVWQADAEGFYDVQQPDVQPPGNGRGLFTADAEGRFWFRTCVPSPYPIPTDGPVGDLLRATGRHPYRPAHIHFIATRRGPRARHHPHLRRGQRLPRLGRRVRGEGEPGPGLHRDRRPVPGSRVRCPEPLPPRTLRPRAGATAIGGTERTGLRVRGPADAGRAAGRGRRDRDGREAERLGPATAVGRVRRRGKDTAQAVADSLGPALRGSARRGADARTRRGRRPGRRGGARGWAPTAVWRSAAAPRSAWARRSRCAPGCR